MGVFEINLICSSTTQDTYINKSSWYIKHSSHNRLVRTHLNMFSSIFFFQCYKQSWPLLNCEDFKYTSLGLVVLFLLLYWHEWSVYSSILFIIIYQHETKKIYIVFFVQLSKHGTLVMSTFYQMIANRGIDIKIIQKTFFFS